MFKSWGDVPHDNAQFVSRMFQMHTSVVRGSAYPEQTQRELAEIQGRFEGVFLARVGIGPKRASQLLTKIIQTQEARASEWYQGIGEASLRGRERWKEIHKRRRKGLNLAEIEFVRKYPTAKHAAWAECTRALLNTDCSFIPVSQSDIPIDPSPTMQEWQSLIRLIGCTNVDIVKMQSPVEMMKRPLFVLGGNRLLLCDLSNALDQLWNAFDNVAQSECDFCDVYSKWKAKWLEEEAEAHFNRLFAKEHVFRGLAYPDPDKAGGTAELDLAVYWAPFLILCEAKARNFRFESQMSDLGRLRTDLERNLEDAFEQARRAARHISSVQEATLTETKTGRQLVIRKDEVKKTYLMTVSLHHLSIAATRLSALAPLGLFQDHEYPYSTSIADLDTITEFCPGPDAFLHYVERRTALEKGPVEVLGDELSLFGAYLQNRLRLDDLDVRPKKGMHNMATFLGFEDKFDRVMQFRRGDRTECPTIEFEIPIQVKRIFRELQGRFANQDARWIAFSLLDLSYPALRTLARMFDEIRKQVPSSGKLCRNTIALDDLVISLIASRDSPLDKLREATIHRALLEKYRRRAKKSIGFGIHLPESVRLFHGAVWFSGEWHQDPNMEALIREDVFSFPMSGSKLPGANEPCFCGSSIKFKKCCRGRIEAARRAE